MTKVLELVVHRFNDGSLAQEAFIDKGHKPIGHVFTTLRNQLESFAHRDAQTKLERHNRPQRADL